jgi:putative membrane protein
VPELEAIDDERILQITHVTNEAEIDAAKLAEARAVDGSVRAFARSIARDHAKAERESEELARVSGLNPQVSETSSNLQTGQHDQLLVLGSKMGAAFDRAYVDQEVDTHRAALKLIDDRLMPAATTDEVKAMVRRIRPELAKQYAEAKALQEKLKN